MFVLGNLKPPYDEWFQRNAWDRYVADLNEEGLTWWFNMETPALAAHLVPLASASRRVPIPPRLGFLSEAVNMTATPEVLNGYYERFLRDGDLEAAAAAAGAAVLFALEMGRGSTGSSSGMAGSNTCSGTRAASPHRPSLPCGITAP